MVVVKIGDGLGNQMFNYVCGYSVAGHDGDTLLLDTSDVDNSSFRTYGLDQFNIDFDRRESFGNRTVFHKIYKRLRRNIKYNVIFEPKDESNPLCMSVYQKKRLRNKYLHGYFQNLYYFNTCREDIIRQFTPKKPLPDKVLQLIGEFEDGNTCSVHIRGGDIPPLSVQYYREAVAECRKINKDMKFIFFSNVHELAGEYMQKLGGENMSCIWDYGSFRDIDELFLMKACQNHILSDSTFSRWGALLDDRQGLVYVADTQDADKIYPKEWRRIDYEGNEVR